MLKKILAILAFLFASATAFAAVDVNKATEAELDAIKGIGPGTSKMILDERKKGEFKSWEDFITRVKGVGDTRAANLSEAGLRVGGKTYKPAADKKEAKADAKADKKDAKAEKKEEKKEAKADAKADKKEAKAEAKAEKKDDKAAAKAEKKDDKAAAKDAKPAASAAKK